MKTSPSFTKRIVVKFTAIVSIVTMAASAGPVTAADAIWTADSNSNFLWSDALNWLFGVEPGVLDDVILPKPIPNPGSLTEPSILTLSNGELANSLRFFAPYTLTGGTLEITTGQVAVTIGNASSIESLLTGSGGLLKLNDGALKLTNALNDYTGTTQIDAGSVIITDQGALGTDSSAIIVSGNNTRAVGGGSLVVGSANNNLTGLTFTRDLALTGGGASGDGAAFNSVGNNLFSGNIVTGGNVSGLNPVGGLPLTLSATRLASTFGTATLTGNVTVDPSGQSTEFTGNGNWLIHSNIDGAGNVIKSGNGLMVLTGNNTFGGVLQLS
jgi:fibronectin-binding autotransporter adhesin